MRISFFVSCLLGCLFFESILTPGISKELLPVPKLIKIVAAENVYGGIAQQIGGSSVVVTSIINNPNQDPHEFQVIPAMAKAIADADIVIYNGMGYDAWIEKMLVHHENSHCIVINVALLMRTQVGDNPHLWYNPLTMVALAKKLGEVLNKPLAFLTFQNEMKPLFEKINFLERKYKNLNITATEPLFSPMSGLLHWDMLNNDYQWAIMNGTEPSFQLVAAYQKSLQTKKVKLLFYNSQVANPSTQQMQLLAQKNDIPVIGLTEMQPAVFSTYQEWMIAELQEIEKTLASKNNNE